jgi:UDP-2,3-diacylglucosamine pyrophosphatase LpxH
LQYVAVEALVLLALPGFACATLPCWEQAKNGQQAAAVEAAMEATFPGWREPEARQCEQANLDYAVEPLVWPGHDKEHILVVSDLHAGVKGEGDDLRVGGESYAALLRGYGDGRSQLVLAGDVFDLAEAEILLRDSSAKEHVQRIAANHRDLFDFFANWVRRGNDLVFIAGNHDTALQVGEVRAQVVLEIAQRMPGNACREDPRSILSQTYFVPAVYRVGPVLVTHGHQADVANRTTKAGMRVDGKACRFARTDGFQAIEFFTPLEQSAGWLDNVQRLPEIAAGMITLGVGEWALRKMAEALDVPPEVLPSVPSGERSRCAELTKQLRDELEREGRAALGPVSSEQWQATVMRIAKLQSWAVSLVASSLETQKGVFDEAVSQLGRTPGAQVLVAGHTHEPPRVVNVADGMFYVNVGTWTASDLSLDSCEEAERSWRNPNNKSKSPSPVVVINLANGKLVPPLPSVIDVGAESGRER